MICISCADKRHEDCANLWTTDSTTAIVRREVPTNTHCDCQHKPSNINVIKSGATEKSEGINGDSS